MKRITRRFFAALAGVLFCSAPAAAEPISIHESWSVFKDPPGICYARGAAAVLDEAVVGRQEAYVQVSHFPMMNFFDTVFVIPGYNYQPGSTAIILVDGGPGFELAEDGFKAVSERSNQADLTAAMRDGDELVVSGVSESGVKTSDLFPLAGFAKAYAEISRLCDLK